MAIDASQLTDYSWSDIKKGAKQSIMSSFAGGATLSVAGRTIGRVTLAEARAIYEWADANEQIEAGGETGGIALVRYGERV